MTLAPAECCGFYVSKEVSPALIVFKTRTEVAIGHAQWMPLWTLLLSPIVLLGNDGPFFKLCLSCLFFFLMIDIINKEISKILFTST